MKLSELLAGLGIEAKENPDITGLANNSAAVEKGNLFIAIKGYRLDGAEFIEDALKKGAAAAITNAKSSDPRVITVDGDMREVEAKLAVQFYPNSLEFIAAATGTNGKSSVVNFMRQMWEMLGLPAASIGTVGIQKPSGKGGKSLTTPDAIDLNKNLHDLSIEGVRYVAVETSSHGIEQFRADGIRIMAAGWTNLSNDHLDYYKSLDDYFTAKLGLFTRLLDAKGTAVINMDDSRGAEVKSACEKRGVRTLSYGKSAGCDIQITSYSVRDYKQVVGLKILGKSYDSEVNLFTEFQIYNLCCALGMVIASRPDWEKIMPRLGEIQNEKGRIELVGIAKSGAPIFVDFGHNGDGLKNLLTDIRPYVRQNLICVAGCSGDRPIIRRIEMGEVLAKYADSVVIVDDDPRKEDPAAIRKTLLEHCPTALEIPSREAAISEVIDTSRKWDTIIICGTQYEKDRAFIQAKLAVRSVPLSKILQGGDEREITGIALDSREVKPGNLFVAIKGFEQDGADYAAAAVANGAVAVVADEAAKLTLPDSVFVKRTNNTRKAFADLAFAFYGKKQPAKVVAITGTSGKSSVVDFVRQMWASLGYPAVSTGTIGIIAENIYSQKRIIKYADDHTTPAGEEPFRWLAYFADRGVERAAVELSSHGLDQMRLDNIVVSAGGFTNLGTDHEDFYGSHDGYLASKERLFKEVVSANGTAVLNADIPEFAELSEVCQTRGLKVISYGKSPAVDLRILSQETSLEGQSAAVELFGEKYDLSLKIMGDFQLYNLLAALGLFMSVEDNWEEVIPHLSKLSNALGRLEFMGKTKSGARVYVDFAYKGDALKNTIATLRPMVKGKIITVFGAGGGVFETNRRRELGEVAAQFADAVFITDDNPRTEDPSKIRAEILRFCPNATECKDGRRAAIAFAISSAASDDIVLITGKGHEDYTIVGTAEIPYADQAAVKEILDADNS